MRFIQLYIYTTFLVLLFGCSGLKKESVDLIVHNATIYTVDDAFSTAEAMAVRGDTIVAIGPEHEILNKYQSQNTYDARKQFIYPGFIDAHAHFYGYALSLEKVNLVGTSSWKECIDRTKVYAQSHDYNWIIGRGWDQNDWNEKSFPTNDLLNSLFPDTPVLLSRIDGHAAIANNKALALANILPSTQIEGGHIDIENGKLTGLLVDNAVELIQKVIPSPSREMEIKGIIQAQKDCFAVGLTSVCDAGLNVDNILLIDSLQKAEQLFTRMYIMVADHPTNLDYFEEHGKIKTSYLNVRSFKFYADGALGSRGAALLSPYSDSKNESGMLLSPQSHFEEMAKKMLGMDFQMNVHCIGDSANRMILAVFGGALKTMNDKRWRIEHAQIVHPNDLEKFNQYTIIPSVQPTHATSDYTWAGDRLGEERLKYAYAYKSLLTQNRLLPLGTDFPVEDISPLKTFYAAVFRKPPFKSESIAFQPEEAISREDALRGMTIWAAIAAFEENEKGSLEPGKLADFVILDHDIMQEPEAVFNTINVNATFSGGELMYSIP